MATVRTTKYNGDKEKLPASLDEALLDEFFSIIAGIAVRLTKDASSHDNMDKFQRKEGNKK